MYQAKITELLKQHRIQVSEKEWRSPLVQHGLDSLTMALFILALEKEFRIKIPLELIEKEYFYSVETINKMLKDRILS